MVTTNPLISRLGVAKASRVLRRLCSPRKRQRGQALPLGIAFIMVGMVGALVLFNTGQVAVNKQRLSDAADSAAYSGLVWQARALNFQAYTNRAMIANDVTIGQAVSLTSWSTYAAVATGNVATVTAGVPILGTITAILSQIFLTMSNIVEPVADVMVSAVGGINMVIEGAQSAMFVSSFIATPDIVLKVAKASDENFESVSAYTVAGMAMNLASWQSFTEKYDQDDIDAMGERTNMVNASRDPFATHRRWRFFEKFWVFSTPFTRHRFYYDGKTRLLMSESGGGTPKWEWVAKDAMSFHTKVYYFSNWSWKSSVAQLPIGWAAAYANSDNSSTPLTIDVTDSKCRSYTTLDGEPCSFLDNNSTAEKLANGGAPNLSGVATPPKSLTGYKGVNAFRSLSQSILEDEDGKGDPVLRLRTEISMDIEKTETSNDWVHDSEPFATEVRSAGNKISSISIAEVYYRHPKAYLTTNEDIARQRANGYNPYWDVRLAPVAIEERLAALAVREGFLGGGSDSSTPGSQQLAAYGGGSDGIDFEVGGNLSGLGDYVGPLATAMGSDALAELPFSTSDVAGFAADITGFEALADINDIEGTIENLAENALENAWEELKDIWLGGSSNPLSAEAQQTITEAGDITAEALALNTRMDAVRDQVAADFEAALLSKVGPYEAEIDRINALMDPVRVEYDELRIRISNLEHENDGPVSQRDALERTLTEYTEEKNDALDDLVSEITDDVMTSLTTQGSEFFGTDISSDLIGFISDDLHPMIYGYLDLTEEERAEHEAGGIVPWDSEDDEEEEDEPYVVPEYGSFED